MLAYVRFQVLRQAAAAEGPWLEEDAAVTLMAGDLIGRLPGAALLLDDARVSEAHAMVSLRGGALKLLALRGRFAVGERATKPLTEVDLATGLVVHLARGLALRVVELVLPAAVMALQGPGLPTRALPSVASLMPSETTAGELQLVGRFRTAASAHIWQAGEGWRIEVDGQSDELVVGQTVTVAGVEVTAVLLPLKGAGPGATRLGGAVSAPLKLVARHDTAHVHRDGGDPVALSGVSARLLCELVAMGGLAPWAVLAGEVWGDAPRTSLRRKLDVGLSRLRRKLSDGRVRPDLVRSDGTGNVELFLHEGDEVVDQM